MKRRTDMHTMLLPGIIEMIRLPDGTASARIKEFDQEMDVDEAARFLGCKPDSVRWLIEEGALAARRLTTRPRSKYKVSSKSVAAYRERMYAQAS